MSEFQVTTATKKLANLYRSRSRKKIVQGGTSAGKTFNILPILYSHAATTPHQEISVVAESIPHLRRGALKDFMKVMAITGRWRPSQFNASTLKYTLSNGSYIEFFSADQPDRLRGARRNVLYLNEANNIPFEAYNQLAIRTDGQIWMDFNPVSSFWAHNEVAKDADAEKIVLTYKDNEALAHSIVKEIENAREKGKTSKYWANWWRVYGLGEIGALEGACIPAWESIDSLPSEARLLCYGLDFGYTNDPSALVALYKWNDGYILDEVFYRTGMLNSDISDVLKSEGVSDWIFADSAEPKSIDELKGRGHKVAPVQKGRDSVVHGINLMNQQKLFVTARSKNLINELQNYSWMKDKDGSTLNKPVDAFNHGIDAARYAMSEQLRNPHRGQYYIY